MRKPLLAAMTLVMLLSACGAMRESRLNPLNWFRRSAPVQTTALVLPGDQVDVRPLVDQVVAMSVEPMLGGAIVRATGLPRAQGFWDGELVARPLGEDGALIFDFRLVPPPVATDISTQRSRQVTVAKFLSNTKLETITSITVQGAQNARSSRR